MSFLHVYGPAILELSFILVVLMLLHSLRHVIGVGAFYLVTGGVLVFAQFVTAGGLRISGVEGMEIVVGSTLFYTPFMAMLLIIYIVDGTLEAQRLIWGLMGLVGVFFYLAFLTERQVGMSITDFTAGWPGYQVHAELDANSLRGLFSTSRIFMLASLLSILIEFLALPVIYEILRGWSCRLTISVFGALIFTQVLDTFFFELVTRPGAENWWETLRASYLSRSAAMLWVGSMAVLYLRLRHAPHSREASQRRPMDIVVAFIGAYGQAQRLQANVREWEGRYRMVVEHTNDLIFLVGESGIILDANRIARLKTGYTIEEMLKVDIQTLMRTAEGNQVNWSAIWASLFPPGVEKQSRLLRHSALYEWQLIPARQDDPLHMDATLTPLFIQNTFGALVVARDITHRKRLETEREQLQGQLMHAQRMEAVGRLAGGIAHDFNNLLHAIRGSVDALEPRLNRDPKLAQMLGNISNASERASRLTGQLLGFARGGKYQVAPIHVEELIRDTESLFLPILSRRGKLKTAVHPDPMIVEGDENQLEQVLLNILINARDALGDREDGRIVMRAEPATTATPGWSQFKGVRQTVGHIVIRIKDNGSGMDPETKKRIFEPFFSTKDSKGTGMGLAMAYGCIENHHGWIHVESEPGKGSEFFLFLPRQPQAE